SRDWSSDVCSSDLGVSSGEGPRSVETAPGPQASEPTEPTGSEEAEAEPGGTEYSEEGEPDNTAKIGQKVTYSDGVEVEITKVKRVRAGEYEINDLPEGEEHYYQVTYRVTNKSSKTVELNASLTLTYGPDGEEAERVYGEGTDSFLDGKLVKGKSKSATTGFAVPQKYADDVIIEMSPTWDHGTAIFIGSLKK